MKPCGCRITSSGFCVVPFYIWNLKRGDKIGKLGEAPSPGAFSYRKTVSVPSSPNHKGKLLLPAMWPVTPLECLVGLKNGQEISVHFSTFCRNRFKRILYAKVLCFRKKGSDLWKKNTLIVKLWEIGLLKLGTILENSEVHWNHLKQECNFD